MNQKLLLGSALLVGMVSTQQTLSQKKKAQGQTSPNVVFILADDLGYGDLRCYGQEKFETPNIDRLAQNGMRFTQCYSGTTVSAPSRSCLITGTHLLLQFSVNAASRLHGLCIPPPAALASVQITASQQEFHQIPDGDSLCCSHVLLLPFFFFASPVIIS